MKKNTGMAFQNEVFASVQQAVQAGRFLLAGDYVRVRERARYYSKDREACIECDIAVEKYLEDPDAGRRVRPAILVIVECKDYKGAVTVDELEEFHAKLQQIGADNTKGLMITRNGRYQRAALRYAMSKGIALARLLPPGQVSYVLYDRPGVFPGELGNLQAANAIRALTEEGFCSTDGEAFFSLTGEPSLEKLLARLLGPGKA